METTPKHTASRRDFLKGSSLAVGTTALAGLLAACSTNTTGANTAPSPTTDAHDMAAMEGTQAGPQPTPGGAMSVDDMDAMHEAGVKAFLAGNQAQGKANQPLQPKMDGNVKVFELTAAITKWQIDKNTTVDAWTYNGTMPGPEIRVTEGDNVRVVIKNNLPESTAIHFHGLIIPNKMDGVPFITQPPIKPGESYTYEFVAKNPGSHMYHSHMNSTKQVGKGLLGAFIIEPKDKSKDPTYDLEYVMILNDQLGGFTLNGKGFPATDPIPVKLGQKIRIRYMNEGMLIHPMHLHGIPQQVFSKDGWNLPQPYMLDTLNIAPGERWDVIVDCTEPGAWAFHCHILSHAEGEHGMFGMVTALVVS